MDSKFKPATKEKIKENLLEEDEDVRRIKQEAIEVLLI